jgi:hypothetical protein
VVGQRLEDPVGGALVEREQPNKLRQAVLILALERPQDLDAALDRRDSRYHESTSRRRNTDESDGGEELLVVRVIELRS